MSYKNSNLMRLGESLSLGCAEAQKPLHQGSAREISLVSYKIYSGGVLVNDQLKGGRLVKEGKFTNVP